MANHCMSSLTQFYHNIRVKSQTCHIPKLISFLPLINPMAALTLFSLSNGLILFSPFLTLGNIHMDYFPSTFSPLDQSLQPKKTTSTQPYNSIFASGQTRSKLCLSSRHGSKPNHPPLLCGPTSSPTSPLSLPLPSPTSPPRMPLQSCKNIGL